MTEEELETHTIAAWKEGKAYLNGQIDGHGRALPRRFIHVSVLRDMFRISGLKMQCGPVTLKDTFIVCAFVL